MVDVEFVVVDDIDDDNVGDDVVIIDKIVFNGEVIAWAWFTNAFVLSVLTGWPWIVTLFGIVVTVCTRIKF